jgi:hypothetical protein
MGSNLEIANKIINATSFLVIYVGNMPFHVHNVINSK